MNVESKPKKILLTFAAVAAIIAAVAYLFVERWFDRHRVSVEHVTAEDTVAEMLARGEHRKVGFDRDHPSVVALHCVAVAVVIQAKATGLGPLEQLAIAEAIMTRSDMGEEGGHPCDIVLAPRQFLGVESFPPPRIPVYEDRDAWFLAQQVTLAAMKGDMRTPCHGATHYFEVADAPADKLRNACVLDKLAFIRIE